MKKSVILAVILTIAACSGKVFAQLHFNNTVSQYFRNRYLLNPAFAGNHTSPYIYGLVNRSWIGFEGAPTLVQFSGDFNIGTNSAGGAQFLSDKSGELERMLAKLSYAYKVKLGGDDEVLRLGFSLTGYRERLSNDAIVEGASDETVKSFNSRGWRFDGDFGAVYQNKSFFFSAALNNLNRWYSKLLEQMPVDLETVSLTTGYTIETDEKLTIQPLVAAKFYSRKPWLCRLGAEFGYDNLVHASVLWQSNNTVSGGVGMQLNNFGELNVFYGSSPAQSGGQQFEVGLGIHLR